MLEEMEFGKVLAATDGRCPDDAAEEDVLRTACLRCEYIDAAV